MNIPCDHVIDREARRTSLIALEKKRNACSAE